MIFVASSFIKPPSVSLRIIRVVSIVLVRLNIVELRVMGTAIYRSFFNIAL